MRNSCDFQFSLDKADRIYEAGADVTGIVTIIPQKTMRCSGLKLELRWRTHGRGNRAQGQVISIPVNFYEAEVSEGQSYEVPFGFTLPSGPLTYHGHNLNIDWYLKAILDAPLVPGFLDPQTETELLVLPKEGESVNLGPNYKAPDDARRASSNKWGSLIMAGIFGGIGLIMFLAFNAVANSGPSIFRLFSLIPLIFVGISVWVVFSSFRNSLASSKLGEVSVRFDKRKLVPGGSLNAKLEFHPQKQVNLVKITMTLKGFERVVRGSGSNRKTFTHTVFEETKELAGASILSPAQHVNLSESFDLPFDAPYTFVASDNELRWELECLIDTQGIIDWKQAYQIDVVPWVDNDIIN
ncbi:MAG: hypothetical protein KC422_17915 [Trueperaceae bacterium]|nr:hypothetical protein [Trueperaceae bacterium]